MLNDSKLIGFVATTDYAKARAFYEGQLRVRFISQDQFALVLDSNGNMIRIPQLSEVKPQSFTVLRWPILTGKSPSFSRRALLSKNMAFPVRTNAACGALPAAPR